MVSTKDTRSTESTPGTNTVTSATEKQIREWAALNSVTVPAVGTALPAAVIERFNLDRVDRVDLLGTTNEVAVQADPTKVNKWGGWKTA